MKRKSVGNKINYCKNLKKKHLTKGPTRKIKVIDSQEIVKLFLLFILEEIRDTEQL